ncbi:SGNH/GDSL hydrolase family protein [Pseudobdellovibrio exovorus]|uniref:Uncharacterized protein n=1 Tax=Pseudobdellovibrio exovorus JSS TaxID=1184267 RepID=M4VDK6_9BACT|nr:SGNH/GDSL hydrolase family protein [Pseudobdellovibrio exovorus]AGH96560.1 hypothetical protein A11Q_2344 [Pseudobdellovibrio exovorus JSS]
MSKFKVLLINVAVLTAILVLMELLASLSFLYIKKPDHIYNYSYMTSYDYDPYLGFRAYPYPMYGQMDRLNPKSIVLLGGSTANGVGVVDRERAFFRYLEDDLKAKWGSETNLINLGVPGYVSNQESASYKNYIFNKKIIPQVIISLTGFNDAYFYLFRTLPIGNHEFNYAFELVFKKGYPDPDKTSEKVKNFVRKSNIFTLYHVMTSKTKPASPIQLSSDIHDPFQTTLEGPSSQLIQEVADNFLNNVLATALLANKKGSKYVVVLQPNYYYGGELTVIENEWYGNMDDLHRWIEDVRRREEAFEHFYSLVLKGLIEFKKQGLLDYLDYRGILADAGPVYKDPVHFNEHASEILGRELARELAKIVK